MWGALWRIQGMREGGYQAEGSERRPKEACEDGSDPLSIPPLSSTHRKRCKKRTSCLCSQRLANSTLSPSQTHPNKKRLEGQEGTMSLSPFHKPARSKSEIGRSGPGGEAKRRAEDDGTWAEGPTRDCYRSTTNKPEDTYDDITVTASTLTKTRFEMKVWLVLTGKSTRLRCEGP